MEVDLPESGSLFRIERCGKKAKAARKRNDGGSKAGGAASGAAGGRKGLDAEGGADEYGGTARG